MFSEYASRFLAQSQTRMSAIREGRLNNPHNTAPLFHSAADFMPPDEEHEQEVQDFYALKSSRRHFGAYASSNATVQEDDEEDGDYSGGSTQELRQSGGKGKSRLSILGNTNTIRSSWRASKSAGSSVVRSTSRTSSVESDGTERAEKGKGRMVDIGLDDSVRLGMVPDGIDHSDMVESAVQKPFGGYERRHLLEDEDDDDGADRPPRDICIQMPSDDDDEEEPAFQQFRRPPPPKSSLPDKKPETTFMPRLSSPTQPRGPHISIIPQQVAYPPLEPPSHDAIWGTLYMVLMTCLFTTSFVVWLHTEKLNLGGLDTVYRTIQSSIHLLTVDTLLAIGVSLVWMYLLRAFVKPLLFLILGAVPIILVALSMYPLIMSYRGKWEGDAPQDKAMRWGSIFPAVMAAFWVFFAWRGKNALGRAIGIIQLACKILGENAALVLLSFGTLGAICVFTWVWVAMFTRMFWMGNYIVGGVPLWHLDTKMMILATYYIMMYLWTLGICSNIQRATSAATVSQWYFHRHQIPKASSKDIMQAALTHSTTTLFGTICFSSLVALLVRVPLMVAPRRIAAFIHMFCYSFITSPVASLTNPLTLTYAAIHSQPLVASSRAVAGMRFIDTAGYGTGKHPRTAYKFSKMLLTATRGITALSMGIGAWVTTARDINGGSAYGYIVGLIAGAIGWAVLGATEGCLSNIVDACLVCVGSEGPNGGHCREAQMVFSG